MWGDVGDRASTSFASKGRLRPAARREPTQLKVRSEAMLAYAVGSETAQREGQGQGLGGGGGGGVLLALSSPLCRGGAAGSPASGTEGRGGAARRARAGDAPTA